MARRLNDIAAERVRERFKDAKHTMRDAFVAFGEGRISYEEAQERFFDGNEELNGTFGQLLLLLDVESAS